MLEIDKVYSYKSALFHSARRFVLRLLPNDIPVVPTTEISLGVSLGLC